MWDDCCLICVTISSLIYPSVRGFSSHPPPSALFAPGPDGNVPLERFDRILNETALRLRVLRGSVESPALALKIEKLHSAAREQQSQMSLIEQDLQEIREERDSLRDIALNLPRSCPQAAGVGKG